MLFFSLQEHSDCVYTDFTARILLRLRPVHSQEYSIRKFLLPYSMQNMSTEFPVANIACLMQAVMEWIGNTGPGCDPNYPIPLEIYEVLLLVLLIPAAELRSIRHVAIMSSVTNAATVIGMVILCECLYLIETDRFISPSLVMMIRSVAVYAILIERPLQSVSRLPMFTGWAAMPTFFSTAIYLFEAVAMVRKLRL